MRKFKKIAICLLLLAAFFTVAGPAQAQAPKLLNDNLKGQYDSYLNLARQAPGYADIDPNNVVPPISSLVALVISLIGVIFFILILYSGFQWMTASGNEEKVTSAKKRIVSASIGLIITLCAYLIAFTVFKFFFQQYLKEPAGGIEPPPGAQEVMPCNGSGEVPECADRGERKYCVDGNCVQCRDNADCPEGTECNLNWHSCLRSAETSCTEIQDSALCQSQNCKWITNGRWEAPEGECVKNDNPCPQCSEDSPVCVQRGQAGNISYSCEECVDEGNDPSGGGGTRGACNWAQTCIYFDCVP